MFSILCFAVDAQTSNYSGTGNWTSTGNWSNGIPTSNTNATTTIGASIIVNSTGVCNNLTLFLSSLTINAGTQLTINGIFTATTTGNNTNNGTLIMRGNVKPAIGTTVLTVNGGVTTVSGLTFPSFTID